VLAWPVLAGREAVGGAGAQRDGGRGGAGEGMGGRRGRRDQAGCSARFGDWVLGGSIGERQYWVWYPFTVGDLNLGMGLLFGFMLLETV
jgi:hypothetical protein